MDCEISNAVDRVHSDWVWTKTRHARAYITR